MQLRYLLASCIAATQTVFAWDMNAWHGTECGAAGGAEGYEVADYTSTGCFNFDMEDGYRIHSVKAVFSDSKYKITIYPKADCEAETLWPGIELTTETCTVFKEWTTDEVIYSYKVTAV
ncbi:hypothetical protein BP00DRAFT_416895 [Aspergillus indologenus CBS 114.80]|uniref:Uncharacterized protein n=1 Tax=Aspergillus indologenus CBS 114.80 TaxID=1450541 RepID=A0A2V5HZA1_9EURO|nr:hypothetical protein BP00DRAFT_416895 [Aspergillus indologenus CBS 114.80]